MEFYLPGELEGADQMQILVFYIDRATPCLIPVDGGAGGGTLAVGGRQVSFASSEWKEL